MTGRTFLLPDLGEGLTEAEIVEWRVAAGDTVTVDQIVVEVETAKAAVELPVPYAGRVLTLHAVPGAPVSVGEPLITVATTAETAPPADTPAAADAGPTGTPAAAVDGAAERYREEERAGSGNVLVGYGTGHAVSRRARRRALRTDAPASASTGPQTPATPAPPTPATPAARVAGGGGVRAGEGAVRVISPLVRRTAREHGIDLATLTPSGPAGIVLRRDVERAVEEARTAGEEGVRRVPLRGVRRTVAEKLARSRREIPDATTWVDVDATGLLEARDVLRTTAPDARIGLLALLARICVRALGRFPDLNSQVDTERGEIVTYSRVHLGFAAQTERGLVVPVVRDADRLTTAELAAELTRLTGLARTGGLPPSALTGGTFTLNNYGVFGVDGSTPIINHPEAALLGVGRIVDKPWAVGGALAVRKVTQLSFTFDHRVCDGGTAGGFLRYVADCVEHPVSLLADL
ncbi:dihydrolipoamide acetyltransferase component of pyruvate dehydrogenase complex [Microtetraspora sp. NBRC 13810]|uniref:dihydrolipoamide acetyltransferase family protein n=1 Tax=Microtetraspora sp. NBRC 13810 TaxID=3030990 RepID=UPI0024A2B4EE|nr:dihydrolipoamide acetyltransferase family protein [Microtetraspora sp. NBRC 13810]GLW07135.1 dihydrolipoamide acetyltransferase component of pyruvate dehydrogenase complex [Microtetraspora sp. NBRC 13810]